jgi:hypothetical protein
VGARMRRPHVERELLSAPAQIAEPRAPRCRVFLKLFRAYRILDGINKINRIRGQQIREFRVHRQDQGFDSFF